MPPSDIEDHDDAADLFEPDVAVEEAACLTYVGEGRYIIGVPAKDLCGVPADEADRLTGTGLYVRADCACGVEASPGD